MRSCASSLATASRWSTLLNSVTATVIDVQTASSEPTIRTRCDIRKLPSLRCMVGKAEDCRSLRRQDPPVEGDSPFPRQIDLLAPLPRNGFIRGLLAREHEDLMSDPLRRVGAGERERC